MTLKEIDVKTFENYAKNNPYRTFMQTKQIGKLREINGWKTYYLGLYDNNKLVGASLLVSKKRHFNKYEFYAPRGPLLDYNNEKVLTSFLSKLIEFVKKHNGYILRIDPYVPYKQKDGKGNIVEDGYDNTNIVNNILNLKFIKIPYEKREQVSTMYVLDTKNKTTEEIFNNMNSSTKNKINKTLKSCIEIKEITEDKLDEFYNIMKETGERKGFDIRDNNYYKRMYELFKDSNGIKYLIAVINLKDLLTKLNQEKETLLKKQETIENNKKNQGKIKALTENIESINKRIALAIKEEKEHGENITLAGSMFILTGKEVIYLAGGNHEEFLHYNSQYLIQWEMIKYAIENGYDRYNFYGIPNKLDENSKDYGVYKFKTGFNGYIEELIGEFEIKTSFVYYLIKLIHKIRH